MNGIDNEGLVYKITNEIAKLGINIEELEIVIDIPQKYLLMEPYPNPFNPRTTISFSIPSESRVSIEVVDIAGRLVQTLIETSSYSKGQYSIAWNATSFTSGLYFVRMLVNDEYNYTKKVLLVK